MPSQSNFNQQLNFQCENASYQQNKLQMLLPNNISFMDSFDHRIPINNSFSSYAKTRKTSKYGTYSISFFSHQAKTRNGTIKSMYISMFIRI